MSKRISFSGIHIIWDWNGTLLDDTDAAIGSLNMILHKRGKPPISREYYLNNFAFPVRRFYARIGIELEKEDWNSLASEYHQNYASLPKRLNCEAFAALYFVKSAGGTQSLLSAHRQDLLQQMAVEYGVAPYMDCIYGVDNIDGASKLSRARELLSFLHTRSAVKDVVMIGDAIHDFEVASSIGVRCVLCAQGGHAAWRLKDLAPTGGTLLEALGLV